MTAAASALIVFGLTALAEWLHGRRIRVADRWRTGGGGRLAATGQSTKAPPILPADAAEIGGA
jgi:hypothetical protein